MNVSGNGESEIGPEPVVMSDTETATKDKPTSELSPMDTDSVGKPAGKPEQTVASSKSSDTSEASSPTEVSTEDSKKVCIS